MNGKGFIVQRLHKKCCASINFKELFIHLYHQKEEVSQPRKLLNTHKAASVVHKEKQSKQILDVL